MNKSKFLISVAGLLSVFSVSYLSVQKDEKVLLYGAVLVVMLLTSMLFSENKSRSFYKYNLTNIAIIVTASLANYLLNWNFGLLFLLAVYVIAYIVSQVIISMRVNDR